MTGPQPRLELDTVLDLMPSGVLIYTVNHISYINLAGARILDIQRDTLYRMPIGQLFKKVPHEMQADDCEGPLAGRELSRIVTHHHNGQTRYLGFRVTSIPSSADETPSWMMLFQDITKNVEGRDSYDRGIKLDSLMRLVPTLIHEIKNPLAGIQSVIEVLLEETERTQHRMDLEAVLEEINMLVVTLERLRPADSVAYSHRQNEDMVRTVRHLMHLVQRRAERSGITLSYDGPEVCRAHLDPDLVRRVLINLIHNAMEATRRGGKIKVFLSDADETLVFGVEDTGCGMSPEVLARATDWFFTSRSSGSGIGLALINEVVEQWKGNLEIISDEGKGTRVAISLKEF